MGNSLRTLQKARDTVTGLFARAQQTADSWRKPGTGMLNLDRGGLLGIFRRRPKSGSIFEEKRVMLGPNMVHAFITRRDGSIEDLGLSKNLLTNIGCMVMIGSVGGDLPAGNTVAADISTGTSGTTITGTGSVWTASALGTPTLGVAGWRVYAAPHTTTNPVVYGNVISNTVNVLTVDGWLKADDVAGTTPTSGDAFIVGKGGVGSARYMALTTSASAAAYTDTTLPTEITTGNIARTKATFARGSNPSSGSGSFTQQVIFSPNSGFTAIHKMGLFCDGTSNSGGPVIFETVLNADATVANGDTLTVTDTITLAG